MADFNPDQYLKEKTAAPFDPDKYLAEKVGNSAPPPGQPGVMSKAWDATKTGLGYGLSALDYAGGVTRTTLAQGANLVAGPDHAVTGEDWKNTLKGHAPGVSDYMEKFGVPEGAGVGIPFTSKSIHARDVGGFIGDIATDPLTYLTLGTGGLVKDALTPAGRAAEAAGDALYKSGFKTVDAKLAAKGIDPLSEVLIKNGRPQGTAANISDKVQKLIDSKMAARKDIYDAVEHSGGKVDLLKAMEPSVQKGRDILRVDPNAGSQVKGMEDWLLNYGKDGQHVPIQTASDYKSRLYNATLPSNAYDPVARTLPAAAEMKQQFARGLKEQIEHTAETAWPGNGRKITEINSDLGTMIAAQKKALPTEVLKSANKNAVTSLDGGLAGYMAHNPVVGALTYVGKKGADIANTTIGRTSLGNMMSRTGREGMLDPLLRRTAIDYNQPPPAPVNPWEQLSRKDR